MKRVELGKATMLGWARLDPAQRDKFFEAFVRAALRLNRLQLREWLRKRLRSHPLRAVNPANFALSDGDVAALLKTLANDQRSASPHVRRMSRWCDACRLEAVDEAKWR
jgi:hypothetical protein